ncbi:polyadenylate-binding protein RBP47 isoform X2 [Daucus carota subsp. sativus]|uniref:polyadenylate-binding protein RBP47 isoform X2 n=1 Tax=Daucus carota subsp. sativus TaxID=79200 RepID=UPI0007EF3CD1|nr:PREDICTED: polyadenylate-binding protein RBP47-like isoform X2 [Daucus carota subsp. sativus]
MQPPSNGGDMSQQQQQWLAMQQQYQQQWLAMQQYPPAAAAALQQQQMAAAAMFHQPPHYLPYHYYQHQQAQVAVAPPPPPQIQSSSEENKTIWIGDLQPWMDEHYLQSCFAPTGEAIAVKIIRNKQTGQSERFGFIEFLSHAAAEKVLQTYNGTAMPNADQLAFRLNWATFSTGERRQDAGSDLSVFVGDLASDVTDTVLHETFATRYPSVRGAKVVVDANTGRSKGYGFVRFGDETERSRAMTEMNGQYCSSRPMRIGVATPKKPSTQQQFSQVLSGGAAANGAHSENDTSNTTVFVGGLDSEITDEELKQTFSEFGEVLSVKIPVGKGCGFVQFSNRSSAEDAIQQLNNTVIGKQTVRLSWGRTPANKQLRMDSGNQWNGNYYGKQGYGYTVPQGQDPNMYGSGAGYGAPTNGYGNH